MKEAKIVPTLTVKEAEAIRPIIEDFVDAYCESVGQKDMLSLLEHKLASYLPHLSSVAIKEQVQRLSTAIASREARLDALRRARSHGLSREEWFTEEMEKLTASFTDLGEKGEYLQEIYEAVNKINRELVTAWEGKAPANLDRDIVFSNVAWNEYNLQELAQNIGTQAAAGVALLTGLEEPASMAEQQLEDEYTAAGAVLRAVLAGQIDSKAVKEAIAGSLLVAAERGLMEALPKGTHVEAFAHLSHMAIENEKVLYQVATDAITPLEALDRMADVRAAAVVNFCAEAGEQIGEKIGTFFFGPVEGKVCAAIGRIIGQKIGEGVMKLLDQAKTKLAACAKTVANTALKATSSFVSGMVSIVKGLCSLFS